MQLGIFSSYDNIGTNNIVLNEFLSKHTVLIDEVHDMFDKITFYLFTHTKSNTILDNKKRLYKNFDIKVINIDNLPTENIVYFTYGNFIDFYTNTSYYKNNKKFTTVYKDNFYINNYFRLNTFFNNNKNVKLFQYMSDPVDLRYDNAILLTPDSESLENEIYFPLYQKYHSKMLSTDCIDKKYNFIMGTTCHNADRTNDFNKYCLSLYEKYKDNDLYRFYIKGYVNYFFSLNNFINHELFYEELKKSKFGLVLKTYSRDIITANKVGQYLSNDVIPILAEDCDEKSNYIPKYLKDKYTVSNSEDIEKIILGFNYEECKNEWNDFKNYLFKKYDFKRIFI